MTQSNTMRPSKFNSLAIAIVVALVVCLALPAAAQAATVHQWIGGDGNFTDVFGDGGNLQGWDAAPVFDSQHQYQINTGATVTVDTFGNLVVVLTIGADTGTPTSGTVIQTGGDRVLPFLDPLLRTSPAVVELDHVLGPLVQVRHDETDTRKQLILVPLNLGDHQFVLFIAAEA